MLGLAGLNRPCPRLTARAAGGSTPVRFGGRLGRLQVLSKKGDSEGEGKEGKKKKEKEPKEKHEKEGVVAVAEKHSMGKFDPTKR